MKLRGMTLACAGAMAIMMGCGGDSGNANADVMCGGDAVGTWKITSSNLTVDVPMLDPDCPTATGTSSDIKASGTLMYNADLSYTDNVAISGNVTLNLPSSCLPVGMSCATFGADLVTAGIFKTAACVVAEAGCTCMLAFPDQLSNDVGTYTTTTAAGVLTETSTGDTTGSGLAYCVKGTTLTESPSTVSMSAFLGSITLAKQ
ncbi:MAG TPA: hypothetical protein VH560_12510 [Polyangia bacterium]|nr:hypothetical protein [Polyangia bacterium]